MWGAKVILHRLFYTSVPMCARCAQCAHAVAWISACATSRVQSLQDVMHFLRDSYASYVLPQNPSAHMTHIKALQGKEDHPEGVRISLLLEPLGTPLRFVCPSLDRWHQSVWKPGQRHGQQRQHSPQVPWTSPQTSAHGVRERNHCRFWYCLKKCRIVPKNRHEQALHLYL